jgi:hypothetical protein
MPKKLFVNIIRHVNILAIQPMASNESEVEKTVDVVAYTTNKFSIFSCAKGIPSQKAHGK